ncbi:unnamed protein product [Ophioblennius macclurei]
MHGIFTKCILFLCVTLVKCRDCTLEDFVRGKLYSPNFDTTGMEASYADERQVRVGCNIGFSGFFKLICKNGDWTSKGAGCEPKSCGHPGDAPFAEFELVNATDFVFGSKVVYICQKGYYMVSRRNYRNCLLEGWDGAIPVCEAQQCPAIHVEDNIKVTGDPEEAGFGNVVLFSCKSNSEVVNGPMEIYCDENGQWSGVGWHGLPPKCEEIKCSPPIIENGYVLGDVKEYKENELLSYKCDPQFKVAGGRSSKCIKTGPAAEWSPTPKCELITCKLDLPPLRGTTYEPASKNVFLPGEKVTVTCEDTYWIGRTDQTSTETTCKEDGEWPVRPVCQEFICSGQRDPLLHYWGVTSWDQKKIGDTAYYKCSWRDSYRTATCTIDGWTPKPLCRGSQCQKKSIENANIGNNNKARYNDGEEVQYTCRNGGKRFTITCENGAWTGIEQCTSVPVPCPKATIPNGFVAGPYKNTIYYTCDRGYKFPTESWWAAAKCRDGVWSGLQRCIEETKCGEPPEIPNGVATEHPQPDEEAQILVITCKKGYSADIEQLTCQDKKWHSNGVPFETLCKPIAPLCSPPPRVENAVVLGAYRKEYISNAEITYTCRENFTMEGEDKIRCKAGKWEEKNTTCIQKPCPMPEDTPNGSYKIVFGKELVFGTMIQYTCNQGYRITSQPDTRTCVLEGWTGEVPICERTTCKTVATHPKLVVTGLPTNGEAIEPGRILDFRCSDDYHLDGASESRCLQSGEWSSPFPTCSQTCQITDVPPNVNHQPVPGNELLKGQNLTFTCRLRHHFIQGSATVQCLDDGKWSHPFPTCDNPTGCGILPPLDGGDTKETVKFQYRHNERVEYDCQNYYVMEGEPYKTCFNGEWRGDVKCLKPCTVNNDDMNRRNIEFKYTNRKKLYSHHNDEFEFRCKRGTSPHGSIMRARCLDGDISLPTCQ